MEDGSPYGGTLLEETFYILSKKNTVFRVKLSEKGLSLQKESNGNIKIETIHINDIIGCRCMRSKRKSSASCACHQTPRRRTDLKVVEENSGLQDESDISAYLYIYAYVLKKFRVKSGQKRERMTVTLRFRSFDKYEDNLREAQKWRVAVKCLIRNKPMPRSILSNDYTETLFHGDLGDDQKLLVLLNPKSGPGKARNMFQARVATLLAEAEIPYDLHVTRHANYAREFVRIKDIYQWRGIVVVGGDGILFEVVNGIFERPDWERAVREIPIGIIPCGSGNGLAKSIAYAVDEPYDENPVLVSALNIVKFRASPMDLVRVETKSQTVFSFLSVGWGLLSDIDIESEKLRAIGSQRFTIWSLARLVGLRTYPGKLWYQPVSSSKASLPRSAPLFRTASHSGDISATTPVTSSKSYHGSLARHSDVGSLNLETLGQVLTELGDTDVNSDSYYSTIGDKGRRDSYYHSKHDQSRRESYFSATSKRSAFYSDAGSSYHSLSDSLVGDREANVQMYGPPSQLPALTTPVPESWTLIEGDFILVHASYQSHIGHDCFFAPKSKLSDGVIWLVIVKAGISRAQLLQFLLGMSNGTHVNCAQAEVIPCSAFRIEPSANVGYMTVDGEVVDYGPIQAELYPSISNIMSR